MHSLIKSIVSTKSIKEKKLQKIKIQKNLILIEGGNPFAYLFLTMF